MSALRPAALALTLFITAACVSYTAEGYHQMIGQFLYGSVDNVAMQWGPPERVYSLTNGDTVYEWLVLEPVTTDPYTRQIPTSTVTRGRVVVDGPHGPVEREIDMRVTTYRTILEPGEHYVRECTTRFAVDPSGVIVDAEFDGNGCVAPVKDGRLALSPPSDAAIQYAGHLALFHGMPIRDFIAANGKPEDSAGLLNGNSVYRFVKEHTRHYGPTTRNLPIRTVKEGKVTLEGPNGPFTRDVSFEETTYETVRVERKPVTFYCHAVFTVDPQGIIVGSSHMEDECDLEWARFRRL